MTKLDIKKQLIHGSTISIIFILVKQLILGVSGVIILRLLHPDEYGYLAWVAAISTFILISAQICSDSIIGKYIVISSANKKCNHEKEIIITTLIVRNAIVLILTLISILLIPKLILSSSFESLSQDSVLIAQIILFTNIFQTNILSFITLLQSKFFMVKSKVIEFLLGFSVVSQIIFIILYGFIGAAIGLFVIYFMIFLFGFTIFWKIFQTYKAVKLRFTPISVLLLKESTIIFVILSMNIVIAYADIIILGFLSPPGEVGYYSFAKTIAFLFLPIATSFSPILYPYIIQKHAEKPGSEKNILDFSIKVSIIIGMFLFGLLMAIGGLFVKWIFPNYIPAIPIMIIITLFLILQSLWNIMGSIFNAYGEYNFILKMKIFLAIASIIANYALIYLFGIYGALFATAFIITLDIGIGSHRALRIVNIRLTHKSLFRLFTPIFFATTMATLMASAMPNMLSNKLLIIISVTFIYILVTIIIFLKIRTIDEFDKNIINALMPKKFQII